MKNIKDRDFVVPRFIMNTDLDSDSKFILTEVNFLSKLEKGCYVSNRRLSELVGISIKTITRKLKELEDNGYIKIKHEMTPNNISLRKITMVNNDGGYGQNVLGGMDKKGKKGGTKCPTNNTLLLSKDNNNNGSEKSDEIKKSSIKIFDSSKQKKIKPKYNMIEGNILLLLEDKVGVKYATMIYANMNDDQLIPTKEDMKYLITEMSKEELITQYGYVNKI